MNDIVVIQLLITSKNKINTHYKQIIQKNNELQVYLKNRFSDSDSLIETIYRIQNKLYTRPVCKTCGKHIRFIPGYGFRDCCSVSCSKFYKKTNLTAVNDEVIINDYYKDGKLNNNKLQEKYLIEHNYKNYLLHRYTDFQSFGETIYRIKHNIKNKDICSICGKPVRLINLKNGYDTVCSDKCKRIEQIPEITDEYLKSLNDKGSIYKQTWSGYYKASLYLKQKYGDDYRDYHEAMYMLRHDITHIPKCPVCGQKVLFRPNRNADKSCYTMYCSQDCYNKDLINQTIQKYKRLSGYDISYDYNDDSYIFKNVCSKHKEFKLNRVDAHNRCGNGRIKYMEICPYCNPERNPETSIERVVKSVLDELNIKYTQHCRNIIAPKELDFYLSDYNVAIECNGMFWHSDQKKDHNYHYRKFNECKQKNIYLLNLWEVDIINNLDNVKQSIRNVCNLNLKYIENDLIFNQKDNIYYGIFNDNVVLSCNVENNEILNFYNNTNYFIDYNTFYTFINFILNTIKYKTIYLTQDIDYKYIDYFLKYGWKIKKDYIEHYFYYDCKLNINVSTFNDNVLTCYDIGKLQFIYYNKKL